MFIKVTHGKGKHPQLLNVNAIEDVHMDTHGNTVIVLRRALGDAEVAMTINESFEAVENTLRNTAGVYTAKTQEEIEEELKELNADVY